MNDIIPIARAVGQEKLASIDFDAVMKVYSEKLATEAKAAVDLANYVVSIGGPDAIYSSVYDQYKSEKELAFQFAKNATDSAVDELADKIEYLSSRVSG